MPYDNQEERSVEFVVLASGSAGNACLLTVDGFGLLIDAGLGPRVLASRLALVGASWASIHALILTHTHSDHWNDRTLLQLAKRGVPFYCHREHLTRLSRQGSAIAAFRAAKLMRHFSAEEELRLPHGVECRPVTVRHDGGATFGFRFERRADLFGPAWAMGYASDLGTWDVSVAERLANVDLLALEFNHDVRMQRGSRRPSQLIERVLGDEGHLSNEQAAGLTREILSRSTPDRLQTLVQLHLSRDCNRPQLARQCAQTLFENHQSACEIHTARQESPTWVTKPKVVGPAQLAIGNREEAK